MVGSGAAGYAAATAARSSGSSVIVLEKACAVGGTTAKSAGGIFWIPNNSIMREQGCEDPRDDVLRYMARVAYPTAYKSHHASLGLDPRAFDLLTTFYDIATEATDRLREFGVIDPIAFPSPDYYAAFEENKAPIGRALITRGAIIGNGGQLLIYGMNAAAKRMGISTLTDHRVIGIIRDAEGEEVIGVQVRARRGTLLVRAHQGVVFASGGFLQDAELTETYLGGAIVGSCSAATSTGDFVRIALDAGADFGTINTAWWSEILLEQAIASRSTSDAVTFNFGDSMVCVNRYGERVMNEKTSYADRGQVYQYWSSATLEYPNRVIFMIWDDDVAQSDIGGYARTTVPPKGESPGYLLSGQTWEELASRIDDRLKELAPHIGDVSPADDFVENLRNTIERFNGFARTGVDLDFGRGSRPIDRKFNSPDRGDGFPNPTLHPFRETGPYYATLLGPGALDSKGGPKTSLDAEVLDTAGIPIPGLYGAGNCVASAAGEGYWGAGGTIGPALAFGYVAGRSAAERPRPA